MADMFDDPGVAQNIEWERLNRRLLLIKPLEVRTGVSTIHGVKDAIRADIHVLGEQGAMGYVQGEVMRNAMIFPQVLQGQLRDNVGTGRYNLGRLGQGVATKGNPPWELAVPTEDDKNTARAYLRTVDAPPAGQAGVTTFQPQQAPQGPVGGSAPPF